MVIMDKAQENISTFLNRYPIYLSSNPSIYEIKEFFLLHDADKIMWWGTVSVYEHTEIVVKSAIHICDLINKNSSQEILVDRYQCELFGWLHDIGRIVWRKIPYDERENLFNHGYCGYILLRRFGIPEQLSKICMTHISGGISDEEIKNNSLVLPFYNGIFATTVVEKIIVMADKLPWWKDSIVANYEKFLKLGRGTIYSELNSDEKAWQRFWSIKNDLDQLTGNKLDEIFELARIF